MLVRGQLNVTNKERIVCGAQQDPGEYDKMITQKVDDLWKIWERRRLNWADFVLFYRSALTGALHDTKDLYFLNNASLFKSKLRSKGKGIPKQFQT